MAKIFLLILIGCILRFIKGANILSVFTFSGKSHFVMTSALMKGLLDRGHKITMVTSFPLEVVSENYTEIKIEPYNYFINAKEVFDAESLYDLEHQNLIDTFPMAEKLGIIECDYVLKQQLLQNKLYNMTNKFDILITEQFYNEVFLALSYIYNIPAISMSTLGYQNYMSQMMGFVIPLSYVPHGYFPLYGKMTLYERFISIGISLYEDFRREFLYFPEQDKLVNKYLSHLGLNIPTVSKMEKNISLMLLNSYIPLTSPRPIVPTMVLVGGLHIKDPKPLPNDIQNFLDSAKFGAIYFSLGSNLQSAEMPKENLIVFINVFRKLKQKVLWKWEDNNTQDFPPNVMTKKWMPQSDILAHKNVKLFISHSGLFGTQESVYHGVPILGFPFFADQHANIKKSVKAGFAKELNFKNLTETALEKALIDLLYDPRYSTNVKKVSNIFKDRQSSPLETAIFWIEYVIRHKGAPHLKTEGQNMPWYTFYLLDIVFISIISIFLIIFIFILLITKLYRKLNLKLSKNKIE